MSTPSQPPTGRAPQEQTGRAPQEQAGRGSQEQAGRGPQGGRQPAPDRPKGGAPQGPPPTSGGPPPWQRGSAKAPSGQEQPRRSTAVVDAPTSQIRRADIPTDMPDLSAARRTSPDPPRATRDAKRPAASVRPSNRGPRRAALQIKHIDPWSALKLSLVLSVALFLVWMIAIGVLYLVLDGMGVWTRINTTFTDFVSVSDPGNTKNALIGPGSVFGVAAVIGAVNVVLYTALATVSSFIYNLSADLVGGVEVTLTERD